MSSFILSEHYNNAVKAVIFNANGKILLQNLEERFKNKGFNNINLVTSAFQAPDFYRKCGYTEEFVRVNKVNPKFTKYFFIKYFEDDNQYQGIDSTNKVKKHDLS